MADQPATLHRACTHCRTMVDLLALAHERGCERELADQLTVSLQARRLPNMTAL